MYHFLTSLFATLALQSLREVDPFPRAIKTLIKIFIKYRPSKLVGSRRVEPASTAFTALALGAGTTSYQFHSFDGYESDTEMQKYPSIGAVLGSMRPRGLFTAVVLENALTSCVGMPSGKTTPHQFIASHVKDHENCIVTNGGFFVTGCDEILRPDYDGLVVDSSEIMFHSVGSTSVSKNSVPVPGVYKDLYSRLEGDDGSFLTSGPDLRIPLDDSSPDYKRANQKSNRLHYFSPTCDGGGVGVRSVVWDEQVKYDQRIHDLMNGPVNVGLQIDIEAADRLGRQPFTTKKVTWCEGAAGPMTCGNTHLVGKRTQLQAIKPVRVATDGTNEYIRSVFAHVPGGIATANQPNERLVLVTIGDGTRVVCSYTSSRDDGLRMNEIRDVIDTFLCNFLCLGIADVEQALNLDGGGSVFVGWVKNGKLKVLASGGLDRQVPGAKDATGMWFRDVTTMVKHVIC
ncbi:hypothetical protein GLAREA_02201 [Glarea lozoyensis ATCC 20868]|uniref:Phosphodiester glycosidase domain-containing protein n=1 Tax=Glarea lozoyensis (strain ATCC 20868 / MF5171) TaxID=1116229 RepID=S3CM70_GLAL2|nr:uncharacterized protein GLAREA_02201 [Glarea lozoyensis ATCC 20868]EPE26289.1 hypothetical protein GLAREA_02201 [Glarea lozoyensis ATCC 20868]